MDGDTNLSPTVSRSRGPFAIGCDLYVTPSPPVVVGVVGRRPTVFIAELISCTDRDAFVGREQRTPDPVVATRRARLVVQKANDLASAFYTGCGAWTESRAPAGQNPRPSADNATTAGGLVQGLGQRHEDLERRPPNRTGTRAQLMLYKLAELGMKHRCFFAPPDDSGVGSVQIGGRRTRSPCRSCTDRLPPIGPEDTPWTVLPKSSCLCLNPGVFA